MDYNEILRILAPCGLNCMKCVGHEEGRVRELAGELRELLGNFGPYAEKFSEKVPAFGKYPEFKEMLDLFADIDCAGCRGNESKHPLCIVARCTAEKGLEFCFQCDECLGNTVLWRIFALGWEQLDFGTQPGQFKDARSIDCR